MPVLAALAIANSMQGQVPTALTIGPEVMATEPIHGAGLGSSGRQAVTSDGFFFYTVWQRGSTVYLSRISDEGVLLDRDGIAIDTGGGAWDAAILWNGSHLLVAWASDEGLRCRLVDRAGRHVGEIENLGVSGLRPHIAWNGTHFLIVAERYELDGFSIRAALADARGKGVARLPDLAPNGLWPAVASDGLGFVVAFSSGYFEKGSLEAIHVDGAGRVQRRVEVDATPRAIASITHDGQRYVIAYTREKNVLVRAVSNDLGTIDPARIVATAQGWPTNTAITWNGDGFLVAYDELFFFPIPEVPPRSQLWGIHLNRSLLAQEPRAISAPDVFLDERVPIVNTAPSLAWNGSRFFVVWSQAFVDYYYQVHGSLLSPDGFPLQAAPAPLTGIPISLSAQSQDQPDVAFGRDTYMAVWRESFSTTGEMRVVAARFTREGQPLDGPGIVMESLSSLLRSDATSIPSIAFDGENFLIVWSTRSLRGQGASLQAVRISPSGSVVDSEPLFISANTLNSQAVACNQGSCVVIWLEATSTGEFSLNSVRMASGLIVDGPTEVAGISSLFFGHQVVPTASGYFLAWAELNFQTPQKNGLYGLHLDARGQPTTASPRVYQDGRVEFAMASNGDSALLVWKRERYGGNTATTADMVGAVITDSDSPAAQVSLIAGNDRWRTPKDLIAVGDDYLLGMIDAESIGETEPALKVVRLSSLGRPRGTPAAISSDGQGPALASDGVNSALALYVKSADSPPFFGVRRVFGRLITLDSVVPRLRGLKR